MVVDRGRKPKVKTKTQSRHSVENSATANDHLSLQAISQRSSKKDRSKSRDSRERSRKHPLSESSTTAAEKSVNYNSDNGASFASVEAVRLKKEIEILKKVGAIFHLLFGE